MNASIQPMVSSWIGLSCFVCWVECNESLVVSQRTVSERLTRGLQRCKKGGAGFDGSLYEGLEGSWGLLPAWVGLTWALASLKIQETNKHRKSFRLALMGAIMLQGWLVPNKKGCKWSKGVGALGFIREDREAVAAMLWAGMNGFFIVSCDFLD